MPEPPDYALTLLMEKLSDYSQCLQGAGSGGSSQYHGAPQSGGQVPAASPVAGAGSQGYGQGSTPSLAAGAGSQNYGQASSPSVAAAANSPVSNSRGRKCRPSYGAGSNSSPSPSPAAGNTGNSGTTGKTGNSGSTGNTGNSGTTGNTGSSGNTGNTDTSGANDTASGGSTGAFTYLPSSEIVPYSGGGGGAVRAPNLATTTVRTSLDGKYQHEY